MHPTMLLSIALLPAAILAATTDINIGQGGLNFDPNSITASPGDLVNFHFVSAPHSVAQSSFSSPCVPSDGGIWSGQINVPGDGDMIFQVNVTDTNPVWLYCAVAQHCTSGMAMVINPPASGNSIDAYKKAAATATPIAPSTVHGGNFVKADQASSSLSASSNSATATSTGTTPSATSAAGGGAYNAPAPASSSKSGADGSAANFDIFLAISVAAGWLLY